jgi:hypothetical protein
MFKTFKNYIIIATLYTISSGFAQADVNQALKNICTIVEADDKSELRKKMRKVQSDFRLKIKDYYSEVSCSGDSLIRTAIKNNSIETGILMVKKMPKGELEAPEKDGKTVLAWAIDNGMDSSPIVEALNSRI